MGVICCSVYDKDPVVITVGVGGEDEEAGPVRGKSLCVSYDDLTILEANLYLFPEA